jgi:hypothetical protein
VGLSVVAGDKEVNTEIVSLAHSHRGIGRRDERLGWDNISEHGAPANTTPLDECRLRPQLCSRECCVVTARSATDHNNALGRRGWSTHSSIVPPVPRFIVRV